MKRVALFPGIGEKFGRRSMWGIAGERRRLTKELITVAKNVLAEFESTSLSR